MLIKIDFVSGKSKNDFLFVPNIENITLQNISRDELYMKRNEQDGVRVLKVMLASKILFSFQVNMLK
jgi:hypothetical protein